MTGDGRKHRPGATSAGRGAFVAAARDFIPPKRGTRQGAVAIRRGVVV